MHALTKKTSLHLICLLSLLLLFNHTAFRGNIARTGTAGPISLVVVGADGTSHTVSDITSLHLTSGSGGYKTDFQNEWGVYQGASLQTLCDSIGTNLASSQSIAVQTSGGTTVTFNYEQVVSGTNIYPQYNTYNNITGILQAPPNPVTLIVAYQFANGSALSGGATHLVMVGPDGYLLQDIGSGVEKITITSPSPTSTPTPQPTVTPTPTPTPSPTPTTSTPTPSPTQTPLPTTTPKTTPTTTPTTHPTTIPTPTSKPISTPTSSGNDQTQTYAIIIAVVVITSTIGATLFLLRRKGQP